MDRINGLWNEVENRPVSGGPAPYYPAGGGISAALRAAGDTKYNLPNAEVGDGNRGYVVDMNGNGSYNRGQDAILGLDFDGDGNLNQAEIDRSRGMFSNWGDSKYDRNRDGKMSNEELNEAGGRTWVDRDGDGRIGKGEVGTVNDFGPNHSRINELDPERRRTEIKPRETNGLDDGVPDDHWTRPGLPKPPKMSDEDFRKFHDDIRAIQTPPKGDGPKSPSEPWGPDKQMQHCPGWNDPILRPKDRPRSPIEDLWNDKPADPRYQLPNDGNFRSRPQDMEPGIGRGRTDEWRPGSSVSLGGGDDLHRPGSSVHLGTLPERAGAGPKPAPAKPRSSTPSRTSAPSRSAPPKPKSAK